MDAGHLALAAASFLTAFAASVAARAARRRRPTGESRGPGIALEVWWWLGGFAIFLFGIEATWVVVAPMPALVARGIGGLMALFAVLALAALSHYLGYLAWGMKKHATFVAFGAGAMWMAEVGIILQTPDAAIAGEPLLFVFLSQAGKIGLAVGITLIGVTLASTLILAGIVGRIEEPVARRRGALFAGAVAAVALAPLVGMLVADASLVLACGLGAGSVTLLAAYAG